MIITEYKRSDFVKKIPKYVYYFLAIIVSAAGYFIIYDKTNVYLIILWSIMNLGLVYKLVCEYKNNIPIFLEGDN